MTEKLEITTQEYKKILLATLDELDSFCRKNDIRYFLIGGTLLGAIRHKGFIPWDDDIDVGMFQEDYEKFKKAYINNHEFYFIDCYLDKRYYLPYGKFCCRRIDLHENINTKLHIGAFIDIFPFNFIKRDKENDLKQFMTDSGFLKKIANIKYASTKNKRFLKRVLIGFCHLIYPFRLNHISKKRIKKAKKISSDARTPLFGNLFGVWGLKEIGDSSNFDDLIEIEFEGKKYFAPAGYDSYLKQLYGNYMVLPPVEKRVSHHSFTAFLVEEDKH